MYRFTSATHLAGVMAALCATLLTLTPAWAQVAVPATARLDADGVPGVDAPFSEFGDGFCTVFTQAATGAGNAIDTPDLALHILNGSAGQPNRRSPDPTFSGIVRTLDTHNAASTDTLGLVPINLLLPWSQPEASTGLATCESPGGPSGVGTDRLAARFRGNLSVPAAGVYTFGLRTDDGYRLTVGNVLIGEFAGNRAPALDTQRVLFAQPGVYPIDLVFWDQGGLAALEVTWSQGDITFTTATSGIVGAGGVNLVNAPNATVLPSSFETLDFRSVDLPTWLPAGTPDCSNLIDLPSQVCQQPVPTTTCGNGTAEQIVGGTSEACDQFHIPGGRLCPGGYTGNRRCNNEPGFAGGNGTCTLVPVATTCVDVNECAVNTDNCSDNAICANTPGSFTCTCNPGFTGNGVTCADINECTTGTDNCSDDATCTNTPGSFTCACDDGYTGDGITCADVNECTTGTDNCSDDATCTNTPGSFTCACDDGYTGDGITCADVNECTTGTDNCSDDATCTNTPGSFTCACDDGYTGDGITCSDIDECDEGTDTCDSNATCANTDGGFTCECNEGYVGDGELCDDIDECADADLNACDSNATCTNDDGSYDCSCNAGYTGDGTICTDIDECAQEPAPCDENATCTNEPGSVACVCNDGFLGDGETCTESDLRVAITSPAEDEIVRTVDVVIEGTATPGQEVIIRLDGDVIGSVVADVDGNWSFALDEPLPAGEYTIEVEAARDPELRTADVTFVVDPLPPFVRIDEPAAGQGVRPPLPAVSGQADPGTTYVVTLNGEEIGTGVVAEDGTWVVALPEDLEPGEYMVEIVVTDEFTGLSGSAEVTFDVLPPVFIAIDEPTEGALVRTTTPTLSGRGTPGAQVVILQDGAEIGRVTVDEDGNWSFPVTEALSEGAITLAVETTVDGTTESDEVSFTIDLVAGVSIESPADGDITNDATPTLSGSAEPGSVIVIRVDGDEVGTTTADTNGLWSFELTTDLGDSDHTIVVEATTEDDVVTSAEIVITVDTEPPALTVDSPALDETQADEITTISGTAEPGTVIVVTVDGTEVGTATADEEGNWSIPFDPALGNGTWNIVVEGTDPAGNTTRVEGSVTVDSTIGEDTGPGDDVGTPDAGDTGVETDAGDAGIETDASDTGIETDADPADTADSGDNTDATPAPPEQDADNMYGPISGGGLGSCAQAPVQPSWPALALTALGLLTLRRRRS